MNPSLERCHIFNRSGEVERSLKRAMCPSLPQLTLVRQQLAGLVGSYPTVVLVGGPKALFLFLLALLPEQFEGKGQ